MSRVHESWKDHITVSSDVASKQETSQKDDAAGFGVLDDDDDDED